ncbi:MAG: aminotransferase class IV [Deltaproteobacteria bacterium]|nr:aminotransferase class IV [Candidatus Anaeroferrophillus wilburensis]MBN2889559.1 aminotransferase class IV [Deltaproteobacteria bacterium]
MATIHLYQNGRYLPADKAAISPFDGGFLYGNGVFETIRLYQGIPFLLQRHLERLQQGLAILNIALPSMPADFEAIIDHLLTLNKLSSSDAMARIVVSSGPLPDTDHQSTCIVQVLPLDLKTQQQRQQGLKTIFLPWRRDGHHPLLRIKSLNYLDNLFGRRLAVRQGADEGIFLNQDDHLCEGTFSNLFLLTEDNCLVTPPVEAGLLPGITRAAIIECCRTAEINCRIEPIPMATISRYRGGFLSSSLMELAPLKTLGTLHFDPQQAALIQNAILQTYENMKAKIRQ